MFGCVSKYHRYALPLNGHAPLTHALIFLEEERENSLAVHYVFKSRNVRGAIQRGELPRQVGKRSGWITSITSYSFNRTKENHQGTTWAAHSFHRTFVDSVGDGVQVVSPGC